MTLAKRLLLGSAAALVATTGAQAADLGLPVAPAVDYVEICSVAGVTGFTLPDSGVCLDISGFARFQVTMNEEGAATNDDFNMVGIGNVSFDAVTMTEFGLLRGYVEFENGGSGDDGDPVNMEKAFIQFAGLTAGVTDSFFDPVFTGEALGAIGGFAGDVDHALIAYTAGFGNGFTATISLEDPEVRDSATVAAVTGLYSVTAPGGPFTVTASSAAAAIAQVAGATAANYIGPASVTPAGAVGAFDESATMPDIVASLRVSQAWGSAALNAALVEVDPGAAARGSEFGFAIGASANINVPFGFDSSIGFMGTYTEGATGYIGTDVGVAGATNLAVFDFLNSPAPANTSIDLTTAWVVGAGFEYGITSMLDLEVDGFYSVVDHDEPAGSDFDYETFSIRGSLAYRPVAGLEIRGGVDYVSLDGASPATGGLIAPGTDTDEVAARLRITRSF